MMKPVFILSLACFVLTSCGEGLTAEEEAQRTCDDSGLAYIVSQDMIANSLRSPSTAEFPSRTQSGVQLSNLGGCIHLISSYVDAQNGFGAIIRSGFVAKVRYSKIERNYRLESLSFE